MKPAPTTMPFDQFEQAYDALAQALDEAGEKQEAVFLAKLALVMAHECGDLALFRGAIATALLELEEPHKQAV